MTETPTHSRRTIVGAVLAASASGGCFGVLTSTTSCSSGADGGLDSDAIDSWTVSVGTNNARHGGSCDRSSGRRCLDVTLTVDREQVERIQGRIPDGEVTVDRTVEDEDEHRIELAVFDVDERVEREVIVVGADDEPLASTIVTAECSE